MGNVCQTQVRLEPDTSKGGTKIKPRACVQLDEVGFYQFGLNQLRRVEGNWPNDPGTTRMTRHPRVVQPSCAWAPVAVQSLCAV